MGSSNTKVSRQVEDVLHTKVQTPMVRPSNAINERDRAILDLKIQRDRLKQYQKKLFLIIEREHEIAKLQVKEGNKERALLALRKKKYQQNLLNNTFSQLLTVEELTMSIEFTCVQKDVIEGLKGGNEILLKIQKELNLEDVEQLMANTSEAIKYHNEISNTLAGLLTEAEEDDLQSELDQIILDKLPNLSDHVLPIAKVLDVVKEEDEEEVYNEEEEEEENDFEKEIY